MQELKRSTLGEQILESVLAMIEEKGLSAGDRLPTEIEIAEKLGVGRNSVREAMKTLSHSGIVQSTAGKGTFLTTDPSLISRESAKTLGAIGVFSVRDLLGARKMIETEAAFLAAMAPDKTGKAWQDFEKSFSELMQAFAVKAENTSTYDFAFHVQLVRLSGNQFLYKMLHAIVNDITKSKKWITIDFENIKKEEELHSLVYHAIHKGDGEAARAAMTAHFDNTFAYCHKIGLFD